MVKKRVETVKNESGKQGETIMGGMALDINPSEDFGRQVIPNPVREEAESVVVQQSEVKKKPLVNCLRNERIIVQFVPKETAMIHDKRHILYGGMADGAVRNFVVPRLRSTGLYKNVLTNDEKDYLEYVMGLEKDSLSIYRRTNNFWDDSNESGIGRVTLHKQDNYFDLSNPADYIKYKILLANNDKIASSLQELEERPKATYEFVIISENAETKNNLSKMEATAQCYMEFGAVKEDKYRLRVIIETLEKRPTSAQIKLDWLQNRINDYIQRDPRRFLRVITDNLLTAKVLIRKSQEAGLISMRNNLYYLRQDNSPLCEIGEDSTLNNAAKYILSPKNQEIKFMLEAKLKEE